MRYVELLASIFLIKRIPAWSSGRTHRVVSTPKLAFTDTGIACMRNLEKQVGDRFVAGCVLCTGQQTLSFGDEFRAVPMDASWRVRV